MVHPLATKETITKNNLFSQKPKGCAVGVGCYGYVNSKNKNAVKDIRRSYIPSHPNIQYSNSKYYKKYKVFDNKSVSHHVTL